MADLPGANPLGDDTAAAIPRIGDHHQSLNDMVTLSLREAILGGRFKPGERLVEDKIARMFGVSRNPVREALKTLRSEGLVEIAARRGASVAALSIDEAAEVIELRAALEGLGARLAARRCGADEGRRMADILDEGERALEEGDPHALYRLNDAFHMALANAGSNRYLAEFMRSLRAKTYWLFAPIAEVRAVESWREHAAILRAVLAGDQELAALLASRHVSSVGEGLIHRNPADLAAPAQQQANGEDTAACA